MGELQHEAFQFSFNGFLKVAFQGSRVTSDAGLILVRELDERLVLEILISEHLNDSRHGLNKQFSLADLLPQSVYSRLAGYEDLNDAVRVSADPTFRLIGSKKLWDRGAALTSTLHWFETDMYRGQGCGNNAPRTRGSSQLHVERGPSCRGVGAGTTYDDEIWPYGGRVGV